MKVRTLASRSTWFRAWALFRSLGSRWRRVRRLEEQPWETVFVEELPDRLTPATVYVLGEKQYLWSVALLCPCSCGEALHMSLHDDSRPRWRIRDHRDGTVTLFPSVWRKVGCRSHFFLRRGRVEWCSAWDFEPDGVD